MFHVKHVPGCLYRQEHTGLHPFPCLTKGDMTGYEEFFEGVY